MAMASLPKAQTLSYRETVSDEGRCEPNRFSPS